jgi:hypothetical protein
MFDILPPKGYGQRNPEVTIYPEGAFPDIPTVQTEYLPQEDIVAPAADIRERGAFLLNALESLSDASKLAGLSKGVQTSRRKQIKSSIKGHFEGTIEGAAFKERKDVMRAKDSFREAYNLGREEPASDIDIDFTDAFHQFSQKYGVGANPEETLRKSHNRTALKKVLKKIVTIPGDMQTSTYKAIPELGSPEPAVALTPELAQTKDKLLGLRDDQRAGFLPTTHTEKNQAFELLDYMDNPKYPKGVDQRLTEIFMHQQILANKKGLKGRDILNYGQEAVTSVVNEWGDYLKSAIASHAELATLKEQLDSGINPHISTIEATEPEDNQTFDYNGLVRFVNLKSLRDGQAFAFDPLKTKQDRSVVHSDKNKIIEDGYTATGSVVEIQNFIDDVAQQLTVKESRAILNEALEDQAARRIFWYRALSAVNEEGFKEAAQKALRGAMEPAKA